MSWTTFFAAGAGSDQPAYDQFEVNGCWIGCGPVAWAMLFGWADHQAGNGNAYWAPRWGIYRQNGGRGADAVAPLTEDAGVRNMISELHNEVFTFCSFGQGATAPQTMAGAWLYLTGRTGAYLGVSYDGFGIHEDGLRDQAINSIVYRHTPAVIGTGWLSHYPLAFGYAWQQRTVRTCFVFCWTDTVTDRLFYVNQGWGAGGAGEWIDSGTWFAGQLYP